MEALPTIDPAVVAVLGIVLSALIAALGYYGKVRRERLRTARAVLFHLLRLYMNNASSNVAALALPAGIAGALAVSLQRHGVPQPPENSVRLQRSIATTLSVVMAEARADVEAELRRNLQQALLELARDDPLLAVRLARSIPQQPNQGAKGNSASSCADTASDIKACYSAIIHDELRAETARSDLEFLRSNVRLAALACGIGTRLDVEFYLWRLSRVDGSDLIAQKFHTLIDSMVARAIAEVPVATTASETAEPS